MSANDSASLGLWGGESEDIIKRDFPVHRACRDGDVKFLHQVREVATREQLTAEDKFYGWTPIHWAAYFGQADCLAVLVGFGIGVNLRTTRFKQTPCHIASFGGHPRCLIQLLRSGANFHAQDYLGETPVHKAARVGNAECIGVLLHNGSRVDLCNNNGHSPCDLARMQGFQECVKLLETAGLQQLAGGYRPNGGSSGAFATAANGHHNGDFNGNTRPNKRIFHDESIPVIKRRRQDTPNNNHTALNGNGHAMNGVMHNGRVSNGNGYSDVPNGNGHDHELSMEMDDGVAVSDMGQNSIKPRPSPPGGYLRAPSPGMDMQLQSDDMQLWCHENGYGDTAEAMPGGSTCLKHRQTFKTETGYDRTACANFRGLQARGWQ